MGEHRGPVLPVENARFRDPQVPEPGVVVSAGPLRPRQAASAGAGSSTVREFVRLSAPIVAIRPTATASTA